MVLGLPIHPFFQKSPQVRDFLPCILPWVLLSGPLIARLIQRGQGQQGWAVAEPLLLHDPRRRMRMDGNGRTGWEWMVKLCWKICTCEPWQSATSQHSSIGRASSSSNSTACWQSCASAGCNCCYTLRILEFKFLIVYGSWQLARGFRCFQMKPLYNWITLKRIKTVIISLSSSLTARAHSNCWASASRSRAAGSFANWGATHKYQRHPAECVGITVNQQTATAFLLTLSVLRFH